MGTAFPFSFPFSFPRYVNPSLFPGRRTPAVLGTLLATSEGVAIPGSEFERTLDVKRAPARPLYEDRPDRRLRRLVANRAIDAVKAQHNANLTGIEKFADLLNELAASTPFLLLHVAWFTLWVGWNMGFMGLTPFDPFPFGLLTMIVSLEAIFLSIFVLMAQKREAAVAELREEMSLQVVLRLEEEVTKNLQLVAGLYTRLGHKVAEDPELHEMLQPLDLDSIERELLLQISTAAQLRKRSR
jgi:uncharacterized membrane protein